MISTLYSLLPPGGQGVIKRAVEEWTDYKLPVPKIIETVGGIEIVIYGTPQEKKESQKNGGIKESGGLNGGINILKDRRSKRRREEGDRQKWHYWFPQKLLITVDKEGVR
jgi:hypothetical protein